MVKVLLLVHGMGVHGAGWAAPAVAAIAAAARDFGLDGALSEEIADGKVALVPVTYDDRFAAWAGRWGEDARALAAFVRANAVPVPASLVSWLERADATENAFFWSHLADVVLYRYFREVTADVRVHVMRAVARAWTRALELDGSARVSVLAYSLGTSVAHDSLALLATSPPAGADGFLAGTRRLAHLFMVSNVSRVLETLPVAYDSVVAPPSVRGARAYCGALYDVRHALDPFPVPRAFAPAWGGDDYARVRTTAVRDFNVHALEHYLADPRAHVPLLRALFGHDAVGDAAAAARAAAYDAAPGPPCPRQLADFVTRCRQRVQLVEEASDVKTLVAAGVHFLADVAAARAACR